jgi:hypothetical protein
MRFVLRHPAKGHPHHVLVKSLHNLRIRQVEPVFQDHEPHHHPGRLGRTAGAGAGVVRSQGRVDPGPVDLSGQHHQGVLRVEVLLHHPGKKARLRSPVLFHRSPSGKSVKIGVFSGEYYNIIFIFYKYLLLPFFSVN